MVSHEEEMESRDKRTSAQLSGQDTKQPERTVKRKTIEENISKAQDCFAQLAPAEVLLSEELIRERRKEAEDDR